jgi:hypothetical protein
LKTAAPRTEKGYVNGLGGWLTWGTANDTFETNPECVWPNSIFTYDRMAREDARVASVLRALGLPIRRTPWRIDPNGARDEVVAHVALDLGLPILGEDTTKPTPRTKGRFSWSEHLQQALTFQQYGHAVFEQVYTIEGEGPNARAHLKKLSPRPQSSIAYWNHGPDWYADGSPSGD